MAALTGTFKEKFEQLSKKTFKQQAIWALNGFWFEGPSFGSNPDECERVWSFTNSMIELHAAGDNGTELDEFKAHRFLEKNVGALTVARMRQVLREVDIDFNKFVSLTEFLVYHYGLDPAQLVDSAQAADPESAQRIAAARRACDMAKASVESCMHAEQDAQKAAAACADAERAAKAALDKLNAEQQAFDDKCTQLEAMGNDNSLGIVKKNRAKQELAQLRQTDPLPLNRAKITQAATVRKLKKAKRRAEKTRAAAAGAREAAQKALSEAESMLQAEVRRSSGGGQGELWWMGRELEEAKKYMSPAQLRKLARQQEAKGETKS